MPLILKSAKSNRKDGHWSDDDYDVTLEGKTIGRIYRYTGVGENWYWGIDFFVWKNQGPQYGRAPTREAAMAAFREAWDRQEAQGSLFKADE